MRSLAAGLVWLAIVGSAGAGESPEEVQNLLDKLKSGDGKAAVALVKHGKEAVPGLVKLLKDDRAFVQGHAAHALGRIGADARDAAPALGKALSSSDVAVAEASAVALGRIGEP